MIDTKIKNEAKNISLLSGQAGEISCQDGEEWYKLTPNATKYYTIYSEGDLDTIGYLYNSSGDQLNYNDDGGYGLNFKIVHNLSQGQTYYIKVQAYGSNTGHFGIMVSDEILIESLVINTELLKIKQDDTATLTATIIPSYATNKNLKWSSSNSSVVSVDTNSGVVTAHNPGTARITAVAQDGSNKYSCCEVSVVANNISISEYGDLVFNGKRYPIYVPDINKGPSYNAVWTTEYSFRKNMKEIDWAAVLAGISLENYNNDSTDRKWLKFLGVNSIASAISLIGQNTTNYYIDIKLQRYGEERRSRITLCTPDIKEIVSQYEDGHIFYTYQFYNRNTYLGNVAGNNQTKTVYNCLTGKTLSDDEDWEYHMKFDPCWKSNEQIAYLGYNNNALIGWSVVFEGDDITFGILKGLFRLNFVPKENVELKSRKTSMSDELNLVLKEFLDEKKIKIEL